MLLTNDRGGYLALPCTSNYHGMHVLIGDEYWKILYDILPEGEIASERTDGRTAVREFGTGRQTFTMRREGLLGHCSGRFTLTLDCKRRFDETENGRTYEIIPHARGVTVRYNGRIHVCIATTVAARQVEKWRPVQYPYDDRRGTVSSRWVYDALLLEGAGRIAVTAAEGREDAERTATALLTQDLPDIQEVTVEERVWRALNVLRTDRGVLAGLPWFGQVWSRDELIALGGFIARGEREFALTAIDRWYRAVRQDGTLPAIHPDSGLESADAPGWLARRTIDLLEDIPRERMPAYRDALSRMIRARRFLKGLVRSAGKTTWMDTSHGDDGRAGARIEIQALFLAMCEAHARLSEELGEPDETAALAERVRQAVRTHLVSQGRLLDGLHDDGLPDRTARPNGFLAWYAYPAMFAKEEWLAFFEGALPDLWLRWGGLASLGTTDSGFCPRDLGEDAAAYHHGDSWYFVNNVAWMALSQDDRFGQYCRAIEEASMRDFLEMGFPGHASEISSAERQEAMGCHAQAWSASTLLEAIRFYPQEHSR